MRRFLPLILVSAALALSIGGNAWLAIQLNSASRELQSAQEQLASAQEAVELQHNELENLQQELEQLRQAAAAPVSPEGEVPPGQTTPAAQPPEQAESASILLEPPAAGGDAVLQYGADFTVNDALREKLRTLLAGYGKPAAFYVFDLEIDRGFSWRADQSFAAASAVKGPFARWCYEQIRDGNASFDDTMIYAKKYYIAGTGIMQNEASGGSYTLQELLYNCLHYSDNIAYLMLADYFGTEGYNAWLDELGAETLHIQPGSYWPQLTARDLAACWREIYEFDDKDSGVRQEMFDVMTGARTNLIQQALAELPEKTVAHKGGWMEGAYHDAGIVLDKYPYSIVVLTKSDGNSTDAAFLKNLIQVLDEMMTSGRES